MVEQQHGQAGFIALLTAAADGHAEVSGSKAPAAIHGLSKPKRDKALAVPTQPAPGQVSTQR